MALSPGLMTCPALLIEAFTERPFAGNGAAVVLLEQPAPDSWMQAVAGSLRQSETAFLLRGPQGWMLRWFTPTLEIDLCGHATLAAAIALGHWRQLAPDTPLALHSRSGPLPVRLSASQAGEGRRAAIELPASPLQPQPVPGALSSLLERTPGCLPEASWTSGSGYGVALLPATAPLADLECLADQLEGALRLGLVLMQPLDPAADPPRVCGESADYQLRFFAPGLGIPEDPVTGSAHALVAPWWQRRLGRPRIVGWQCSDRPGGMVCEAASSGMIRLTGSGYLLWDGTLRTPCDASAPTSGALPGPLADADSAALWTSWFTATRCAF